MRHRGLRFTGVWALTGMAALAGTAMAEDDRKFSQRKVSEISNFVDRANVSLADAIRKAENECRGTAIGADVLCDEDHLGSQTGDAPHYKVTCLAQDRIMHVHIDGRSGQVLAIQHSRDFGDDRQRYTSSRWDSDSRRDRDFNQSQNRWRQDDDWNRQSQQDRTTGWGSSDQDRWDNQRQRTDRYYDASYGLVQDRGTTGRFDDNQQTRQDRYSHRQTGSQSFNRVFKASDLIGMDVENFRGEDLGEIQDLAIDPDRNMRIVYAVLGSGGFLGLGEKWFAIPINALSVSGDRDQLLLNVDEDRLRQAQGFDKDRWPTMGNSAWATSVHEFYGQRPYWQEDSSSAGATLRIVKASELIGRDVHNNRGEDIGDIDDLAVDLPSGNVVYAVLSFGGFMGLGDKLFAIPPQVLQTPSTGSYAVINVDRDRLRNARGFDRNNWPNLADENFASSVYGYYGQTPYWTNNPNRR